MFDDILDCSGDQAATGKRPGTDVRDGTVTLPLIYALEARPELAEILRRPDPSDAEVDAVLTRRHRDRRARACPRRRFAVH